MTNNITINSKAETTGASEGVRSFDVQFLDVSRVSPTIKFLEKWRDLCCSNENDSNPDVVRRFHIKLPRKLRKKLKREGREVPRTITINESIEDFQNRVFKGICERPE